MNNGDTPKPKPRIGKILLATVLIIFCLFIVGTISDSLSGKGSSTASAPAVAKADQLELLSYKCTTEYGYFTISGQVKNISSESLKNVTAVGTTYTSDGQFINSDSALTEYNPILAGQTSPFKVMMTLNPAMKKCDVSFKELLGGTIQTKDSSSIKQ